ncbi:hypothetical protein DO71_3807 [Burkholderia pseudomallei]|nr:non-ribosomal peptide synthetase domain protein [Burkholderia pseudomallei]KGC81777.1 hypothetical protein DO71_3807 [Burkholderia pseudomallei]
MPIGVPASACSSRACRRAERSFNCAYSASPRRSISVSTATHASIDSGFLLKVPANSVVSAVGALSSP